VGREGSTGSEPVPDVFISLSPAGGTAAPLDGLTDAQGEFVSEVLLDSGSSSVEIIVQALTGPGGEVLDEEVVLAVGPCVDAPANVQLDFGTGVPDPTVDGPTLQNGVDYRVTVSGTYTVNSTQQWQNGVCKGAPAAGAGGPTGIDAEFFFAVPNGSALCEPDFVCCPNHTSKFRVDVGGGFGHVEPISPAFSASHTYEYLVQGQGAPVRLQLQEDNSRGDDYGILDITVACANPATTTTTTTLPTTTTTIASTTSTLATSTTATTTASSTSTLPTSTSTLVSTTTTSTLFAFPVVPYTRYAATGPDGPFVSLEDEFGSENVDLGAVTLQLPPVSIEGVAPFDPFTHQTCHAHPGASFDACIDVQDVFGTAPLRIGNAVALCAHESGGVIPVDSFKCYAASGAAPGVDVALTDEFQSRTVTVGAPDLFCTPAEIDGSLLAHGDRYLVCYATAPSVVTGGQIQVSNALHAAPIQVDVGAATGLCVPAVRQLVPTCQLCANGTVDPGEDCDDGGLVDGDGCSAVCRFERDCTCNGLQAAPPNGVRCATVADCGAFCGACEGGGGTCGCD
jgi:cysteine-rich repeat protein